MTRQIRKPTPEEKDELTFYTLTSDDKWIPREHSGNELTLDNFDSNHMFISTFSTGIEQSPEPPDPGEPPDDASTASSINSGELPDLTPRNDDISVDSSVDSFLADLPDET